MVEQADRRRFPIGAEVQSGHAHLRVWAPRCGRVAVVIEGSARSEIALSAEGNGYFSGSATGLGAGGRYWFRLDDQKKLYPDPASRFQPEGPSATGAASRHGARSSTSCTSGPSPPRGPTRRRPNGWSPSASWASRSSR